MGFQTEGVVAYNSDQLSRRNNLKPPFKRLYCLALRYVKMCQADYKEVLTFNGELKQ